MSIDPNDPATVELLDAFHRDNMALRPVELSAGGPISSGTPVHIHECGPGPCIIQGLIIRPGDTLIVAVDRQLTLEIADRYKAQLRERLPGLADVIIVLNASGIAAYRPEGPTT